MTRDASAPARGASGDFERWKTTLLTLPDSTFFDIMHNYLGDLRTPFNKHSLIDELYAFMSRPETIERILLQIDEQDSRLLSAIEVLGEPEVDRLFSFFSGAMSYLELHHLLLNLEERLLVYRESTGGATRIAFSPILRERLRLKVTSPAVLFPSYPIDRAESRLPWLSDSLLLALFSYFIAAKGSLKGDGTLKKRSKEELIVVFPTLSVGSRMEMALKALTRSGLLQPRGGELVPSVDHWRSIASLDPHSRASIVWAAALEGDSATGGRRRIEARAEVIAGLLANLDPLRAYSGASLAKIASATAAGRSGERDDFGPAAAALLIEGMASLDLIVTAHAAAGLESESEGKLYGASQVGWSDELREERPAVVEPNFQITVKPSLPFDRGLDVALMAEIRRFDLYSHYEITKSSFTRALELGISSGEAERLFELLGDAPLPQNVRFSLDSWQKEFDGLSLSRGVVLTADSERRHLIEHSEAMRPYIRKQLAPGVYLLDPGKESEWKEALRRAGIGTIPIVRGTGGPDEAGIADPFHPVATGTLLVKRRESGDEQNQGRPAVDLVADASRHRGELLKALEALSLPDELRQDMEARIRKKLILYETQLRFAASRQERTEAKGLDYVGKVRLIEQALDGGTDLLEILERQAKGGARRLLVKPLQLGRVGDDLLLSGRLLPEETPVQIKVRKIGLVRKLRGSLYAP